MSEWNTVAGFVQFEPQTRETKVGDVLSVDIQAIGSGGKNVRLSIWPELQHADIALGDFVAASGKFTADKVKGETYYNLSVQKLFVAKPVEKNESERPAAKEEESEEDDLLF